MLNNFVVYIDFDSTLYNTAAFSHGLWTVIARKAGISIDQVKTDAASYFFHPTLGGYEYEKHIAIYGLNPEEMWQELDDIVRNNNYLYQDSPEFMQSLVKNGYRPKILTFGEKRFQLAKIYPTLKYFSHNHQFEIEDVIVVDKKKNEHINLYHKGQKGVLVDDKPDQDLPSEFTEIHINREFRLASPQIKENIAIVSDLTQARVIIDKLNSL
jgi:hypothetical protein